DDFRRPLQLFDNLGIARRHSHGFELEPIAQYRDTPNISAAVVFLPRGFESCGRVVSDCARCRQDSARKRPIAKEDGGVLLNIETLRSGKSRREYRRQANE